MLWGPRRVGDAMLEAENWKVVLELYNGHPVPALLLAHQLNCDKTISPKGDEKKQSLV
jgi:hypothetical protein